MPTQNARRLTTIAAAAEHVPCSQKTIRRLISRGELTAYQLGGHHRILRVDLDQLDALMRPIPTAKAG